MNFGRFGKIASVSLIGAMLLAGCSGNGQTVMKIGEIGRASCRERVSSPV